MDASPAAPRRAAACQQLLGAARDSSSPASIPPAPRPRRPARASSSLLAAGIELLRRPHAAAARSTAYEPELPAGVEYLRTPIPDHGLPETRAHMREILDCLRARAAPGAGRLPALPRRHRAHRHGGRVPAGRARPDGRGGARGAEPALAAERALAAVAPVPETDGADATTSARWTPRAPPAEPRPAAASPRRSRRRAGLRERFLGALLGLAVGDAVAAATQYRRPGASRRSATCSAAARSTCRAAPGATTPRWRCAWPRACSSATASMRATRWSATGAGSSEGYLSATGQCVGITAGTARALALAQWRRQPFSGSHDPEALDPEALSRVAPVVMYFFADASRRPWSRPPKPRAPPARRPRCWRPAARSPRALARGARRGSRKARRSSPPPQRRVGQPTARAARRARGRAGLARTGARSPPRSRLLRRAPHNFRDAVLAAANLGGNSDVVAGGRRGARRGALQCRRHPRFVAQQPDETAS